MPNQLYMVVEHFKDKDALPVYRRFRDKGRMAPEGLGYVSSRVDETLERCFQLMEAPNRELLDLWIANWTDLVDFEIWPVIPSKALRNKLLRDCNWAADEKRR
jgi:hypothetical protein